MDLLVRVRAGDANAVQDLLARLLPQLRRWARGRLPEYARALCDTEDLVQETMIETIRSLSATDPSQSLSLDALSARMRQMVLVRLRNEVRRAQRRASTNALDLPDDISDAASPLEQAIGREATDRYQHALASLSPRDRQVIVARVELQQSYDQIAKMLSVRTADAARLAVSRALTRLSHAMRPAER
jgi:RNA polymerase sigma-70 factor (ECF subfamily)